MDKHEHSIYRSGKAFMAAGLAVLLLIGPSFLSASGHSDCKFPDKILLGNSGNMLLFEKSGKSEPMLLDEIGILTKGKWLLGLWTPGLWWGEVGIYLYPWNQSAFLATYEDVDTTNVVQFFAVCKTGKQYATIPGTFTKSGDSDVENLNAMKNWSGYLGMTLAPEGTEPVLTLKGDLIEFASRRERQTTKDGTTELQCQRRGEGVDAMREQPNGDGSPDEVFQTTPDIRGGGRLLHRNPGGRVAAPELPAGGPHN